jgi:NADH-quinone oxidoreductase subunit L
VVAWVGGSTALIAATIAVVQTDFKRVLAYSTISQLGYMMLALGLFGYVAAIFHLFTHAFFKALLFLGSGSVNHATNTFDMRKMGGLRSYMPITFWTFTIGSLSLAGIFPLAGFWSKDEILLDAWNENRGLYIIGAGVAFLTAFYMFRAIFMTFFGEYQGGEPVDHEDEDSHFHGDPAHPHESPWTMALPLVVLAVPAIAAGWFAFGGLGGDFTEFINGALPDRAQLFRTGDRRHRRRVRYLLQEVGGLFGDPGNGLSHRHRSREQVLPGLAVRGRAGGPRLPAALEPLG